MSSVLRVSGEELERRRELASELCGELPPDTGRFIDDRVANGILALYPDLRLKQGLRLVTAFWRDGIGGRGVTFAIPEDSPTPEVFNVYPESQSVLAMPSYPEGSIPEIFDVIEGDDSLWAYLDASILRRELDELGAWWHGLSWSTHSLLDGPDEPETLSGELKWRRDKTTDRTPLIEADGDTVIVTFWTVTSFEQERVIRHTDRFKRGSYLPVKGSERTVATGSSGYIF